MHGCMAMCMATHMTARLILVAAAVTDSWQMCMCVAMHTAMPMAVSIFAISLCTLLLYLWYVTSFQCPQLLERQCTLLFDVATLHPFKEETHSCSHYATTIQQRYITSETFRARCTIYGMSSVNCQDDLRLSFRHWKRP